MRSRSGGPGNRAVPDAPPGWKPKRGYHYRNLAIFIGFLAFGAVLIIVGAITIPREAASESVVARNTPSNPPATTTPAATATPSPPTVPPTTSALVINDAQLTREELRTDPNVFFRTSLSQEDACSPPTSSPAELKSWLRTILDRILSFGIRVAGSNSPGFNNTHHMLTHLSSCESRTNPAERYWRVWHDNSTQNTPIGRRFFSNVIAEMNHPPRQSDGSRPASLYGSKGHLLVSAHFDSMLSNDFEFLGACDSASPVAMILQLMRRLSKVMREAGVDAQAYNADHPAITVVFFDGEEAFVRWQGTDNTYGSRNLAARYETSGDIGSIDTFLLLDLLGPVRPVFHNYFPQQTGNHYTLMRTLEQGNKDSGARRSPSTHTFFPSASYRGGIEDDHIPWLQRGVPILHLIPAPFPPSWHTARDDGTNIDDDTAADLYDIVEQYTLRFDASAIDGGGRRRRLGAQSARKAGASPRRR